MKTITYHKLVRDRIPEIIEAKGKTCKVRTLSPEDYLKMIDAKLDEELAEYHEDQNIEELADLMEVIYAAAKARGYSIDELESVRAKKAEKRGAFEKRLLLEEVTEGYPNLIFLASCRSCDSSAFVKLIAEFCIEEYIVEPISDNELVGIIKKYQVIRKAIESGNYVDLLRSPFYINELVSRNVNLDDIADVNSFRMYIWKECICLNRQAFQKGISTVEVVKTVRGIVLERARSFNVGIPEEKIDANILELLQSHNVITVTDNKVRLKYDIYEDICFEMVFDEMFEESRGVYSDFFANVANLGDGAYRRYQIWISNKLLAKENRDKFLYALVFDSTFSNEWRRNTLVGLLKSTFCIPFFNEYGDEIIEKNLLNEFIDITNCFTFEMGGVVYNDIKSIWSLVLKAVGNGRVALIDLICKKTLYKQDSIDKEKIIKLCNDYALRAKHNNETDECVCEIAQYYIEEVIRDITSDVSYRVMDHLRLQLEIVYALPRKSHEWLCEFWSELKESYMGVNPSKARIAEDILSWTLDNPTFQLVDEETSQLFDLAVLLWTKETDRDKKKYNIYGNSINDDYLWGIRGVGEGYNSSHRTVNDDILIRMVLQRRFRESLTWAIELINYMVSSYHDARPEEIEEVEILLNYDERITKKYLGSDRMWYAGREDSMLPTLLGDLVFWVKESAIHLLHSVKDKKDIFIQIAENIKSQVINQSNSIVLLSVIEDIGFEFVETIPGYAAALASSLELITWDIEQSVRQICTPAKSILLDQLKMAVGLPSLEGRYPVKEYRCHELQGYMALCQLVGDKTVALQCGNILDYLYSRINPDDASELLQIQKMDMRNHQVRILNGGWGVIEASLSKGPQRIVEENEAKNQIEIDLQEKLKKTKSSNTHDEIDTVLDTIEQIKLLMITQEGRIKYENYYIEFLCLVLNDEKLSRVERTKIVCDWVERITNVFSNQAGYIANLDHTSVLIQQYWSDVEKGAINKLKYFMLKCLISPSANGQVVFLRDIILEQLKNKEKDAKIFFNTILVLAVDEWQHKKYNQNLMNRNRKKIYSIPAGVGIPKSDDIIRAMGLKPYKSKTEKIIQDYLLDEKGFDVYTINICEMNPLYLSFAVNSGMHLINPTFAHFMKELMPVLIRNWEEKDQDSIWEKSFELQSIEKMFIRELDDEKSDFKETIDILFDGSIIDKVGYNSTKMYISVFGHVWARFFDSYDNRIIRRRCCKCIEYVEKKIKTLKKPLVRNEIEKILIPGPTYGGDWNKCETHYSSEDKRFICRLWGNYFTNHEVDIISSLYQMKIGELYPEVLPVIYQAVDSLVTKKIGIDKNCKVILKTFLLRGLVEFSNRIKEDKEYHDAYVGLLNLLIDLGDETSAVILDEYETH